MIICPKRNAKKPLKSRLFKWSIRDSNPWESAKKFSKINGFRYFRLITFDYLVINVENKILHRKGEVLYIAVKYLDIYISPLSIISNDSVIDSGLILMPKYPTQ